MSLSRERHYAMIWKSNIFWSFTPFYFLPQDGGLYDKLYLCLYYTITELVKKWHSENPGPHTPKSKKVNAM